MEPRAFDYDDVTLVPRVASTLAHRSDADPHVTVGAADLQVPLLGSPMPDVCGVEMCLALAQEGALGILHRFQTVDAELRQLRAVTAAGGPVGAAIGVTGDYQERFDRLTIPVGRLAFKVRMKLKRQPRMPRRDHIVVHVAQAESVDRRSADVAGDARPRHCSEVINVDEGFRRVGKLASPVILLADGMRPEP